jgi:DNA primase
LGGSNEEDNMPLQPISEKVLDYYLPYGNKIFEEDGISLETQRDFNIGYDPQSNRVTIPLLSPTGDLCGVKGRLLGEADEYNPKYMYIMPTAKAKLLYGLYENRSYIKNSNYLYIFEAEKSVLQCATMGVRNAVATGGKTISASQIELITRTSCTPILALDKDVTTDELKAIASMFMDGISVYAIIDYEDILDEKESPSDNPQKWDYLIKNHLYKIKGGDTDEQQTSA